MRLFSTSERAVLGAIVLASLMTLAWVPGARGGNDESAESEDAIGVETTRNTLARFRFEGLPLAATLDEFQRKFPTAQSVDDSLDNKSGLQCYTATNLKSADAAQFYFYNGKLYQMEIEYSGRRVDTQGGLEAVVRKVMSDFGQADEVYRNRRTWHQRAHTRRADFYTSRGGAQLVVTDTSLSGVIEARQKRTALEENVELGF